MSEPTFARDEALMGKVVSLAKRRGFVFQSSEIYGGLKSAYDYGPLGTELKRNLSQAWWRMMVQNREDVVGLDASIIMHPAVWKASGHLAGFSDPLVDCLNCKERFRADKAPQMAPGTEVQFVAGGKRGGARKTSAVGACGYVCPQCGAPELSDERAFNLMFRTHLGSIDPVGQLQAFLTDNPGLSPQERLAGLQRVLEQNAAYLRPETAQAMFVQFANVQQSMGLKIPFGIAQIGKSFRNEITTEHFIFRSCEFEQMEMEFFVEPGTQQAWLAYWRDARLEFWKLFANDKARFRARAHTPDELAHYADACYDIEYAYPWGWGELEGVASRTDYDLGKHQEASGQKLSYFEPNKSDPAAVPDSKTGVTKLGWRYLPYVIEPAAGLTRGMLVYLCDAYHEEAVPDAKGADAVRVVLRLHPVLAPIKVAVLPLVKKDGMPELARTVVQRASRTGIVARYDEQHAIGRRYRRHDEVGTPFCLTIDGTSKEDGTVTLRHRDSMLQERMSIDAAIDKIRAACALESLTDALQP